jgi:hypothetical protein
MHYMTIDQTAKLVVCYRHMRGLNLDRVQNYTDHGFLWFCFALQTNISIFSEIRSRLLSSTSFSTRYSPSFHNLVLYSLVVYSVVKRVENKLSTQINK